jgi:hypothetical protein
VLNPNLIDFENKIVDHWENAKIRGPVHLSNGNESALIEIFKRIHNCFNDLQIYINYFTSTN